MPGNDYESRLLTIASLGLNLEMEPTLMGGKYSPYMKNMIIDKGNARKFLGYSDALDNQPSYATSQAGMSLYQYNNGIGYPYALAMTSKLAFAYYGNSTYECWWNINPGEIIGPPSDSWVDDHADLTASYEAGGVFSSCMEIEAAGSVSDDDKICHVNFDSTDLTDYAYIGYWIKQSGSIVTGSLELVISENADGAKAGTYVTTPLLVTVNAIDKWTFHCVAVDLSSMNAAVSIGIWNKSTHAWVDDNIVAFDSIKAFNIFNTSTSYPYDFAVVTDTNEFAGTGSLGRALIITGNNSTDGLMSWQAYGESDVIASFDPGITNFKNTLCIEEFWNHFFIGNYTISTTANKLSLGHAALGNVDDWSSAGSGYYTLTDTKGEILAITKHDYELTIYSKGSISRGIYYGSYVLFTFPCLCQNLGLDGIRAVTSTPYGDFFIGSDKHFYFLAPGQKPVDIGGSLMPEILSSSYAYQFGSAICGYWHEQAKVFFCLSDSAHGHRYVYVYNLKTKGWEYFYFQHAVRDFEELYLPLSYGATRGFITCLIDQYGSVFKLDEPSTGLMGASDIACEYQTEDVTIDGEHSNARWKWFTFTAKSSIASKSVVVQYSTDNGSTWTSFEDSPVSLTSAWVTHRIPLDVLSRVIRFRFTQTSGDLQVKANMFYGFSLDTEED